MIYSTVIFEEHIFLVNELLPSISFLAMEVKTWKIFGAFLCCVGFFLALSSKSPVAGIYAELNLRSGLCIHLEGLLLGFPNCDPTCALSYSVCCVIQQAGEGQALYLNL